MSRFGVWYDDGHISCGWLATEGRHGRQYRAEYLTLEEAQAAAEREAEYDKKTVFYPASLDSDHEGLFKIVRELVKRKRLEHAEAELKAAKSAFESAFGLDDRKSAYQRLLDDEDD